MSSKCAGIYQGTIINTADWKTGQTKGRKWAMTQVRPDNVNGKEVITVWADNPEIFDGNPRAVVVSSIRAATIRKTPYKGVWWVYYQVQVHLQESATLAEQPRERVKDIDARQGAGSGQEKSAQEVLAELFGVEV